MTIFFLLAWISLPLYLGATISITPTSIELTKNATIGELLLENRSDDVKLFEASIKKWQQIADKDVFEATNKILILPLSAVILPHKKQKFRIVLREPPAPTQQNTYRLFLLETQKRTNLKTAGISFMLNLSVPVFANGLELAHDPLIVWSARELSSRTTAQISLINKGAKTVVIGNIGAKKSTFTDPSMHYLLPGSQHHWQIPCNQKTEQIELNYRIGINSESIQIPIEKFSPSKSYHDKEHKKI